MKYYKYLFVILFLFLLITLNYNETSIIVDHKKFFVENDIIDSYNGYSSSSYDYSYENEIPDTSSYIDEVIGNYRVVIEDDAVLLSVEEREMLFEEMKDITKYGNVAFKTINYNPNYNTATFAREYYHEKFGNSSNGILLLIDMANRMIYIFSDGDVYDVITTTKANVITDNVYRYASKSEYYECASKAFNQIYSLLSGGKINEPMKYITNAILSIVLAALLGFLYAMNKASLKSPKIDDFVKHFNKRVQVVGDITFEKTGQRKVYSPQTDSSSGGSSSSGGGGGGGSSGGGGGHRF